MDETIKNIINLFPVWEPETWEALQAGRFKEAARRFQSFLSHFSDEELNGIAWEGLLDGIPAVRGELSSEEWLREVGPRLATAALELLHGRASGTEQTPAQFSPIPLGGTPAAASAKTAGGEPLIIHEEKAATSQEKRRPFSLPFSLFPSKPESGSRIPVKAKIETPKNERRVVHYSESRTPLTPFGGEEEFINLETFERVRSPAANAAPEPSPSAVRSEQQNRPQNAPAQDASASHSTLRVSDSMSSAQDGEVKNDATETTNPPKRAQDGASI